jgi:PAS domain S-box-containing protein
MSLQYTPFVLPFLVSAVVTVGVTIYAVYQGRRHGFDETTVFFVGFMLSTTIWTVARLMQYSSQSTAHKEYWIAVLWIGFGGCGITLFFLGLAFTGRTRFVTRRNVFLASLVPLIGVGLVLVNVEQSGLFWTVEELTRDDMALIERNYTSLYWLFWSYNVLLVVTGIGLLLRKAVGAHRQYRNQAVAIGAGSVVSLVIATLYVTEQMPVFPAFVDLTPVGFALLGMLCGYAIYRFRLLDLAPIARQTVWDEMGDAVVALDSENRVLDCNTAARELFEVDEEYVGIHAACFFDPVPEEVLKQFEAVDDIDTQFATTIDGRERHFSLDISPIEGGPDTDDGRVIVIQDVTHMKRREEELDLLRQVQSRVLRHNIRNELTAIRGNAAQVAAEVDGTHGERLETVVSASEDLLSISRKTRLVEDVVDGDTEITEYDLRSVSESAIESVQERYPELAATVEGPETCYVECVPNITVAIENIVENAAEHNDSSMPRALVRIDGDPPRLAISDNGPGIPEEEITVLEQEEETALTHGSGIGLWLVKWVVERSSAELTFETDESGTTVILRF